MKEKWSKKEMLIGALVGIVLLLTITLLVIVCIKDRNKEESNLKEETITAYVKINPLVKLTFKSTYYDCKAEGKKECGKDFLTKVSKVVLINDDAKNIYKAEDFIGKSLDETVYELAKIAKENNINIENLDIISTKWSHDYKEIEENIKNKIKTDLEVEVNINFDFKDKLNEEEITGETPKKEDKKEDPKQDENKTEKPKDEPTVTTPTNPVVEPTPEPTCTPKKFSNTYTYYYSTLEVCNKEGNNAFFEISDNVDDTIFTFGCEEIKDDCGDTYYGVYFNRWVGPGDNDILKLYY